METYLTSRERILRAVRCQPVDHVPLLLRFWDMGGGEDHIAFPWRDQIARAAHAVSLGLDDTLLLEPPGGYCENYRPELVPGVTGRTIRMPVRPGEELPRLVKVYETPAGALQTAVLETGDWPHGEEIRLFDDYNLPRLKEPLVKTADDLPALRCLLGDFSAAQIAEFQAGARTLTDRAGELAVTVDGGWSALGDAAVWLLGMERVLYGQRDEPELIEAVLDVLLEWELRRMEQTIELGADIWVHMAWYEGTDFWSPRAFRRFLKPRLAQLAARSHAHGKPFRYIITRGWKPLAADLVEIGVDCLTGADPVQDNITLAGAREVLGERLCIMGGINSAVMLSHWETGAIRAAIHQAVETLGAKPGFILFPVDAVFNQQPWDRVQAVIDAWREFC